MKATKTISNHLDSNQENLLQEFRSTTYFDHSYSENITRNVATKCSFQSSSGEHEWISGAGSEKTGTFYLSSIFPCDFAQK